MNSRLTETATVTSFIWQLIKGCPAISLFSQKLHITQPFTNKGCAILDTRQTKFLKYVCPLRARQKRRIPGQETHTVGFWKGHWDLRQLTWDNSFLHLGTFKQFWTLRGRWTIRSMGQRDSDDLRRFFFLWKVRGGDGSERSQRDPIPDNGSAPSHSSFFQYKRTIASCVLTHLSPQKISLQGCSF